MEETLVASIAYRAILAAVLIAASVFSFIEYHKHRMHPVVETLVDPNQFQRQTNRLAAGVVTAILGLAIVAAILIKVL